MAVTTIKRPQGYKLASDLLTAVASNNSADVLFTTSFTHGFTEGDVIYISSDLESYNGFKIVYPFSTTTFKIKNIATEGHVPYKQSVSVTYQVSILTHAWQCVHLPIVYELLSDQFPINQDTSATVVSFSDYNGYVDLTLSSAIADFGEGVALLLSGDNDLAGVYNVVRMNAGDIFAIDLVYDAGYDFTGLDVTLYRQNYAINVNVYAGIPNGHPWEDEKPYAFVTQLKLIPDADNKVKFSISEVLKTYIETRNNLTLDTLPNNIDFWTSFYISYFESYDIVGSNDSLITFEGDLFYDPFEGKAVNAKLPFKNKNSGYLTDYIDENSYLAKWLTLQSRPLIVIGKFFDISFINIHNGDIMITMQKSLDGNVISNEEVLITNPGIGVLRLPLYFTDGGFDELCVQANTYSEGSGCSMPSPSGANQLDLDPVTPGVYKIDWMLGTTPDVTLGDTPSDGDEWRSKYLVFSLADIPPGDYTFEVIYSMEQAFSAEYPVDLVLSIIDDTNSVYSVTTYPLQQPDGIYTQESVLTVPVNGAYLGIQFISDQYAINTYTIEDVNILDCTPSGDFTPITEEICFDVVELCDDTIPPSEDNIRLTEDGNYRILE